jgi:hypothetical protein
MLLLGTAIMDLAGAQLKRAANNRDRLIALDLAEAGVDYALYQLEQNPSWTGEDDHSLSPGTFSVVVTTEGSLRAVASTCQFHHDAVQLRALVEPGRTAVFARAIFGDLSVTLSGNGRVDTYDSRNGPYPGEGAAGSDAQVGSNGPMTLSGNANIRGDARGRGNFTLSGNAAIYHDAHSGGSLSLSGNAAIYGDAQYNGSLSLSGNAHIDGTTSLGDPPPSVTLPPVDFGDSATNNNNAYLMTQPNWSQSYNNSTKALSISGNRSLTLTDGIYYFSSISISGNGSLIVNGTVTIYCTGSVSLSGNGIVNNSQIPTDLVLFSSGTSVSLSGNGNLYGAIYAPNASIPISGNGTVYGSLVGRSLNWSGNGSLHYDKALGEVTVASGGAWRLRSWEEL